MRDDYHRRALDRLRTHYESRDECLALILVGSLATGDEKEDSDVDHIVVTTDEEFEKRMAERRSHYWSYDFCDREGLYVEGKFVSQGFIHDASERGSEPTRYSFRGATVVFSKIPRLADIVARIPVYQERELEHVIAYPDPVPGRKCARDDDAPDRYTGSEKCLQSMSRIRVLQGKWGAIRWAPIIHGRLDMEGTEKWTTALSANTGTVTRKRGRSLPGPGTTSIATT